MRSDSGSEANSPANFRARSTISDAIRFTAFSPGGRILHAYSVPQIQRAVNWPRMKL
jgi:hypothetical protein